MRMFEMQQKDPIAFTRLSEWIFQQRAVQRTEQAERAMDGALPG